MLQFLSNILPIVVLGIIVWRRGRDPHAGATPSTQWLRIAGLVPLALQTAFYLFFGFGEMLSGDLSGAAHLLPAVVVVLFAFLAWRRPLEGGIALLAAALLFVIPLLPGAVAGSEEGMGSPALLLVAAPQLLAGALFLAAGFLSRRPAGIATGV